MVILAQVTRQGRALVVAAGLAAVVALTALVQARPAGAARPVEAYFSYPDLQVTLSRFVSNSAGTFLHFRVTNTGDADAGAFAVQVKTAPNGAVVQTFAVAGLAEGASQDFTHKLPVCIPYGALTRTIVADSGNTVNELWEWNNEKTVNFIYGPSC